MEPMVNLQPTVPLSSRGTNNRLLGATKKKEPHTPILDQADIQGKG